MTSSFFGARRPPAAVPVLHEADLPLAGDFSGVLLRRVLHGRRGRRHHDAVGQARAGRTQLVGGYVSCGSWMVGGGRGRRGGEALGTKVLYIFPLFYFK